jgi:hypothetical protein
MEINARLKPKSASLSCESPPSNYGAFQSACTCSTFLSQPQRRRACDGARTAYFERNCITSCREIYFCRAAVVMQESEWGNEMAFARSHPRMAGSLGLPALVAARFCSGQHRRGPGEEHADWVVVGK